MGVSRSVEEFFSLSAQRQRFHQATKLHDEKGAENGSQRRVGWEEGRGDAKPGCACIAVTSAVPPVLTGPIKD